MDPAHDERVLILDFGSQYTQLIARRVREAHVYCEIHPFSESVDAIKDWNPTALILSGGPASVHEDGAPLPDARIFDLGLPMLGICYGMQVLAHMHGGKVAASAEREYGSATLEVQEADGLFRGLVNGRPSRIPVWMSHGDRIEQLPDGFEPLAVSDNSPFAAIGNHVRKWYGLQFHPEVIHTPDGAHILSNFLRDVSGCTGAWTIESFIEREIDNIRNTVGDDHVVLGLSGGVDSSVAAALIHEAIGDRLHCVFVDNGLLRKNEADLVEHTFRDHMGIDLTVVDASELFLGRLKSVADPEKKRKIIGRTFIQVFNTEAKKIPGVKWLAQGTLYPDVIESVSVRGPSATIKSHHNVGGLPQRMKLKLLEPFRELFKDEVREVGKELGVPDTIIHRHPFPGPGLAVRILGAVTKARCDLLREADFIVEKEIEAAGIARDMWQCFSVLLPVRAVGVMGDKRTYEHVLAIRAVTSVDGMTADWARIPADVLARLSNRLINEVAGINRVVYDISSKPPATIEWE